MTILLLFYLIGCCVSIFVMIKHANIIKIIRHINSINEASSRIFGLCFTSFAIISYAFMSWLGAIVTYICFNFDKQ